MSVHSVEKYDPSLLHQIAFVLKTNDKSEENELKGWLEGTACA